MERAIREAFEQVDLNHEGVIQSSNLRAILSHAGALDAFPGDLLSALEANGELLSLATILQLCSNVDMFLEGQGPQLGQTQQHYSGEGSGPGSGGGAPLDESGDPRVVEFIATLSEYQAQCEMAGNYEEAARCLDQLARIRREEEGRRVQALRVRHVTERGAVVGAQAGQFGEFNASWDRYLSEYDAMATMFVKQLQARHLKALRKAQEELQAELVHKPVKFGREVLDWRAKEANLIKHHKYSDAARIKAVVEELERRERGRLDEERLVVFSQREARFRLHQKAELEALVTRIDTRRAGE